VVRCVTVISLFGVALGAVPSIGSGGNGAAVARAVPAGCQIAVRYISSTAGTGDVFAGFGVWNRSVSTCSVSRYPSLTLFSSDGRPLRVREHHGSFGLLGEPIRTLAPGGSGGFQVIFSPLTPSGTRRCPPAAQASVRLSPQASVRITLPRASNKEREPINPCQGSSFLVSHVVKTR
jgi:hypothetical protein